MRGPPLALALCVSSALAGCLAPSPPGATVDEGAPALVCVGGAAPTACNVGLGGPGVNEFSAAANPTDPLNAIVTANDYGAQENPALRRVNRVWGSWWFTRDGGETWEKRTLPGMLPSAQGDLALYQFVGDLVVAFDAKGVAHLSGIGYTAVGPVYRNVVFYGRSTDGGETFPDLVHVDSRETEALFHDKPALAIDEAGRLFLAWNFVDEAGQRGSANDAQMRFATSVDGGATWAAKPIGEGETGISASIAIGPDQSVNVAWRSYEPNAIRFARSLDHGASFTRAGTIRSLADTDVALPGTTYRAFLLPTLVALPDGRLLCVTADSGPEGDRDVFLARWAPGERNWSVERLNRDDTTAAQLLPTLASDARGRVVAAWLDRRDDASDSTYRLYAAVSGDGRSFTELPVASAPSADPNAGTQSPVAPASTFIGDYLGAAIAGDRVYLAWPDLREGDGSHLWTAALRFGP